MAERTLLFEMLRNALEFIMIKENLVLVHDYIFAAWEMKVVHSIAMEQGFPAGLGTDETKLFMCTSVYGLLTYSLSGRRKHNIPIPSLNHPEGIEMDPVEKKLYVLDQSHVRILSLETKLLDSWPAPGSGLHRAIKLDDSPSSSNRLYLTPGISDEHYVYVYTREGKLLEKIGNKEPSKQEGQFHDPRGITVDDEYIYVCDRSNSRIQKFKKDWQRVSSFGNDKLIFPVAIFRSKEEAGGYLLYVGDAMSVHIFTTDGFLLQRIGGAPRMADEESPYDPLEFRYVYSLLVVKDHLYVSDCGNHRVKIFRRNVCW